VGQPRLPLARRQRRAPESQITRGAPIMLANQFKQIAELLAHRVVVRAGRRAIVILSHEDVDLGIIGDDELIVTGETKTPFGRKLRR